MLRKTVGSVGSLAQEAVTTAVNVAKHPIGSASLAVGFAKGLAGAGVDLVRGGRSEASTPAATPPATGDTLTVVPEQATPEASGGPEDPRDDLPGPDLAQFEPPQPDELPEPIVIEADDAAAANGESGEPFHNEPKPASRDAAHGGPGTDFEEAEGFAEEIPADLRPE